MNYYLTKTVDGDFKQVVKSVIELLEEESIEVITKIEVDKMLNKKLDLDYKKHLILGTCDPVLAIRALQAEDKIGTLLPCNVSIIKQGENKVEVAIVNATNVMRDIKNSALQLIASEMREKFERILLKLK